MIMTILLQTTNPEHNQEQVRDGLSKVHASPHVSYPSAHASPKNASSAAKCLIVRFYTSY
jgi:hypothetical protein